MAPPIRVKITDLPSEILTEILKRVSPKELLRCLCVLKSWNSLIRSKGFYKAHLNWSLETNAHRTLLVAGSQCPGKDYTDFFTCEFYDRDSFSSALEITQPLIEFGGETIIAGCCDGLVCLFSTSDHDILGIWNPSIQKFKAIPRTPYEIPKGATASREINFGFGSCGDDYRVVRVFGYEIERDVAVGSGFNRYGSEVKVYSVESASWKKIECASCKWDDSIMPIPLQDALHWFGRLNRTSKGLRILTLDLKSEMFKEFLTPFEVRCDKGLAVLKGNLCIGDFDDSNQVAIWEMKNYGLEAWTPLYTINKRIARWTFKYCIPMASSKTGDKSLFRGYSKSRDNLGRCKLFWYDSENYTAKTVAIPGMPENFDAAVCVANIGLLDGVSVIDEGEGYKPYEITEEEESRQGKITEEEGSRQGKISEGGWSDEGAISENKRVRTK